QPARVPSSPRSSTWIVGAPSAVATAVICAVGVRHHSYVSLRADGVIAGCGVQGYARHRDHQHARSRPRSGPRVHHLR
ncbi:hypothetical protein ABZT51_27405, partial [Streptomyces sp. NPDC005373]